MLVRRAGQPLRPASAGPQRDWPDRADLLARVWLRSPLFSLHTARSTSPPRRCPLASSSQAGPAPFHVSIELISPSTCASCAASFLFQFSNFYFAPLTQPSHSVLFPGPTMLFPTPSSPLTLAFLILLSPLAHPASALPSGPAAFYGAYNPATFAPNLSASDPTLFRPHSRAPKPALGRRTFKPPRFARDVPTPSSVRRERRAAPSCCGTFELAQSYEGAGFLDGFEFFTGADPTHGQVAYQSQGDAVAKGLAYTDGDGATVLRVDSWTALAAGQGRDSVRIESKETIGIGSLVVLDASKVRVFPVGVP